jgi:uncharacterized protein YhaN
LKIRAIRIAGYGRFKGESFSFSPGLQIIIGPNEKGKSTIRSFLADMLYGQKRNDAQRVYDESNALRAPWNGNGEYGGSLRYDLDDGRSFEIVREFDKDRESIRVWDRTEDKDITDSFTRFRNRELDFARRHLGLSKDVFLNTATISHTSLTELGDSEALDQIREAVLALADSGGGAGTVEGALDALARRISAIGRPDAKSKPLPMARQQLAALRKEYQGAREQQDSLRALAIARKTVLDDAIALQREKAEAEAALAAHEHQVDVERLRDVEQLQAQIDVLTRQCEALGAVQHFPLDLDGEVQALHGAATAAARQWEKSRERHEALAAKLAGEQESSSGRSLQSNEFPPALEQQLNETQATLHQLEQRIEEARSLVNAAKDRMEEVQRQLADMPDFSRLSADPVEWLSQLASSFAVALRARDEECAMRASLRKEVAALREMNAPYDPLFEPCADFSELAREYEVQVRLRDSQRKQHASDLHSLQGTYEEVKGELHAFLPLGIVCLIIAIAIGSFYFLSDNREMGYGALLTLVVGLIFLTMHLSQQGHLKRLSRNIGLAEQELANITALERDKSLDKIDDMLRESGLQSVRELEALYDQYKSTQMELKIRDAALSAQEEKAAEAEERVPQLLNRFQETFAKAGETIHGEKDVQEAAGRAIARYQVYREAKRRSTSNRSVLERHEAELKRLELLAEQTADDLAALEEEAREFVRDYGLPEIDDHAPVKDLINAFREGIANSRELQGRHDMLSENLRNLERQMDEERAELDAAERGLTTLLSQAGIDTIDQWKIRANAAREFQVHQQELRRLEDRLHDKLDKHSVLSLHERVARFGQVGPLPESSPESLREQIAGLNERIDRKFKEEHALHVELTEQGVRTRSLGELEEEIALVESGIVALEAEVEAASYAMALMEAVAQDKHAEIAPKLARTASEHLAAITSGGYSELYLGRDLRVSVRIPETDHINDAPEKSLSKGTVDQIYLALRLAFVQCVSENGEGIPMLLDDPFANYDDERLESAMGLITNLVGQNQILLFTCREDVAAVAERLNASVIRL